MNFLLRKFTRMTGTLLVASLFFSCTTNGTVVLDSNDSGAFYFDTSITENLDKTIRAFGDVEDSQEIFSEPLIKAFFEQVGLEVLSVEMLSSKEISFSGVSPDLKNSVSTFNQPIVLEKTNSLSEFRIDFTEETVSSFISSLDEDSLMYIDLFQAPLFTREEMNADEYEEFIAALYGQTLSDDLKESYITFKTKAPSKVKEVSVFPTNLAKYTINNDTVSFSIKLSELLSNSSKALIHIKW